MYRILPIAFLLLLVPASTFAARSEASFSAGRSLIVASSSPGNAYVAGFSVVTTAPIAGDLAAVGGSVVNAGPVRGDALLLGGSVSSRAPVAGDLRAIGGSITTTGSIAGDLSAFGFSVRDSGRPEGSVFVVAADATLLRGAAGPVVIYGNNVLLAGDFGGDVKVTAIGRLTVAASTTIRGALRYEAPELAGIPDSAVIAGGVTYSNASYLPDAGTSRILALVGIGVFLFVRILGALILAGLLAGLFPRLAQVLVERVYERQLRSTLLTMLLGFGILVATPVLIVLLTLTFVGIGLAFLLFIMYALLAVLALLYAGILVGGLFARRFLARETVLWRDGVLGMLALSLVVLVPVIGPLTAFFLTTFATGALLQIFFNFAFPREETPELL